MAPVPVLGGVPMTATTVDHQGAAPVISGRDLTILRLAAEGGSNAEIAAVLGISQPTVQLALTRIGRAWGGVGGRPRLVAEGYLRGVLVREPTEPGAALTRREFEAVRTAALTGACADDRGMRRAKRKLGARTPAHAVKLAIDTGQFRLVQRAAVR